MLARLRSDSSAPTASRLLQRLALATFVLTTIASSVGSALSPYLMASNPVLLLLLAPMGRHVALVAPYVALVPLLLLVVFRRVVSLAAAWVLGASYGPAAVDWIEARSERGGWLVRTIERLFVRCGTPLLLVAPTHLLCVLAGAARARAAAVLALVFAGEIGWTLAAYRFGHALAHVTRPLVGYVSDHVLVATLITIGVVALLYWFGRRRR